MNARYVVAMSSSSTRRRDRAVRPPEVRDDRARHRNSAGDDRAARVVERGARRAGGPRPALAPARRETQPRGDSGEAGRGRAGEPRRPAEPLGPCPAAVPASGRRRETDRHVLPRASELSVPRLPVPTTLEPLCRYVDFQRRLELAASELRARLAQLPADRWRIEPYPLTGERRNTFVILGETGIFVDQRHLRTRALGRRDRSQQARQQDPGAAARLRRARSSRRSATRSRRPSPGSGIGPTSTATGSAPGWSAATPWSSGSMHFGPQHGLSAADLARFDRAGQGRTG